MCADERYIGTAFSPLIFAILFLFGCFLFGCASSDLNPKKQDKEMAAEAAKAYGPIDDAKCQSQGFQPGSPAYAQCRKEIENIHKQVGVE
jgi:hypothetical protein